MTDTATTTATTATRKGEQTRLAILDAAIARFGREGYRATSVADIARDAGVSGTAAYAYFPNKEALFRDAVDADAAGLVNVGLDHVATSTAATWHESVLFAVAAAIDDHPLARRLLAGLEPEVTERVLDVPALADLRQATIDRIREEQAAGTARTDIDAASVGNGLIAIILSLLMSLVQVGGDAAATYAADISTVFAAALVPIAPPR